MLLRPRVECKSHACLLCTVGLGFSSGPRQYPNFKKERFSQNEDSSRFVGLLQEEIPNVWGCVEEEKRGGLRFTRT